MALYVIESSFHHLAEPEVRTRSGAVGKGGGSEKLYLHVREIDERTLATLAPRVDEHGNRQHDRLARPGDEDWWIAVEGEKTWPGIARHAIASRCTWGPGNKPIPRPLSDDELAELRRVGAIA